MCFYMERIKYLLVIAGGLEYLKIAGTFQDAGEESDGVRIGRFGPAAGGLTSFPDHLLYIFKDLSPALESA